MRRDFTVRKRIILGGVILLVLADVGLAAYSWQLSSALQMPQQQRAVESKQHDLLKADIKRAQDKAQAIRPSRLNSVPLPGRAEFTSRISLTSPRKLPTVG